MVSISFKQIDRLAFFVTVPPRYMWWMEQRSVNVRWGSQKGQLNHYSAATNSPRPEMSARGGPRSRWVGLVLRLTVSLHRNLHCFLMKAETIFQ